MDSRSTATAAELTQSYQHQPVSVSVAPWSHVGVNGPSLTTPRTPGSSTPASASSSSAFFESAHTPASSYPPNFDLLAPLLISQRQAQLLQYNNLIAPGRGGGGLQPTTLGGPPVPNIQAAPRSRSRSSSKVSSKDGHSTNHSPVAQKCHGTRGFKSTERTDREGMTMEMDKGIPPQEKGKGKGKNAPERPYLKTQPDLQQHALGPRPARGGAQGQQLSSGSTAQSNSVPNTPQQRARGFSSASRDPSPTGPQLPSPRSIHSEPNGGVASLPLRQRLPTRPCQYETAQFKQQRRMPYSLDPDIVQKVDVDKIKSKLSKDEERRLSTDMREIYDRLLPSNEVEENREKLVQKLEKMFNDEWPGHDIRVHRFGSSGNLLCSDDSDVDICITTEWKELEGVCIIADLLARHGMEKVVCVSGAKVPIVKIWDPVLKLNCDMNVNNTLALENTRMIRTYVEIDERVRPLAMMIKYWTRRRVVNDAAYGATLSSYTWICMIVAFLQLRQPPVLPALHQMPHLKLPTTDGHVTEFADDLERLKGWGKKNKSTIGELLFQFFRFFAYEFDYDNQVLSVRLGKLVHKKDKAEREWQHMNNYICVEEPFNRVRNLANTADQYSFIGLHMEMRRAFELIAAAKLEECCEQFVFPRHEPTESKVFVKPPPRPVIVRSSSQTHPSRGGRSTRGNRTYRNGTNRRASSSNAYENTPTSAPAAVAAGSAVTPMMIYQGQDMTPQELHQWAMAQQHGLYYPQSLALNLNLMQQDHQARQQYWLQMYNATAAQRGEVHATSTGRSRTNSFDQQPTPLTTPIHPHHFAWPHFQQQAYVTQNQYASQNQRFPQHYTSFPNTPATAVPPEFGRNSHRSTTTNEGGSSNSGTLRSQSQPASRTPAPDGGSTANYAANSQTVNGAHGFASRAPFIPSSAYPVDDRTDMESDDVAHKLMPDSDTEEMKASHWAPELSPRKPTHGPPSVRGGSPLRDASVSSASRRRMSADGPQAVLDRRLQRTSRSPSPAPGHGRNVSIGTHSAPLASAPFTQNGYRPAKESSPLVVNGSTFVPSSATAWQSAGEAAFDNPLRISQSQASSQGQASSGTLTPDSTASSSDRPVVVNGSATKQAGVTRNAAMPGQRLLGPSARDADGYAKGSRSHQQLGPLDLAVPNALLAGREFLSPINEHRTPTPTTHRIRPFNVVAAAADDGRMTQNISKSADSNGNTKESVLSSAAPIQSAKTNGHAHREHGQGRHVKAEHDTTNEWQQAKGRKKQAAPSRTGKSAAQSEKPPKDSSERKGG